MFQEEETCADRVVRISTAVQKASSMVNAPVSVDGGRGYHARLSRVEHPRDVEQLRRILAEACGEGRQVCVRGAGRSQGGLVLADDAVVVDTSRLDRIVETPGRIVSPSSYSKMPG